jgi:hypothetical protein
MTNLKFQISNKLKTKKISKLAMIWHLEFGFCFEIGAWNLRFSEMTC